MKYSFKYTQAQAPIYFPTCYENILFIIIYAVNVVFSNLEW